MFYFPVQNYRPFTHLVAKFFCLGKPLHIHSIIWHTVFTHHSCSFSSIVHFFTSVLCPTFKTDISYLSLLPAPNSSSSPVCKILHQYEAYSQSSPSVSTKFPFSYPVSPPSSNISDLLNISPESYQLVSTTSIPITQPHTAGFIDVTSNIFLIRFQPWDLRSD
jgi:hypothetical protein